MPIHNPQSKPITDGAQTGPPQKEKALYTCLLLWIQVCLQESNGNLSPFAKFGVAGFPGQELKSVQEVSIEELFSTFGRFHLKGNGPDTIPTCLFQGFQLKITPFLPLFLFVPSNHPLNPGVTTLNTHTHTHTRRPPLMRMRFFESGLQGLQGSRALRSWGQARSRPLRFVPVRRSDPRLKVFCSYRVKYRKIPTTKH